MGRRRRDPWQVEEFFPRLLAPRKTGLHGSVPDGCMSGMGCANKETPCRPPRRSTPVSRRCLQQPDDIFLAPSENHVRLQFMTRHNRPVQREIKKCVKPSLFPTPEPDWQNPAAAGSISPPPPLSRPPPPTPPHPPPPPHKA